MLEVRHNLQIRVWRAMEGTDWVSPKEISDKLKYDKKCVCKALQTLRKRGCVERVGMRKDSRYRRLECEPINFKGKHVNTLRNLRNVMNAKVKASRKLKGDIVGKRTRFVTELERLWIHPQFAHLERGAA